MNTKHIATIIVALTLSASIIVGCGGGSTPVPATNTAKVSQLPPLPAATSRLLAASPTALAVSSPVAHVSRTLTTLTATNPVATPLPSEPPLAPEQNPVGDIPDTQAFVSYSSPSGGYTLDVPEGWARSENGADVSFVDKLDGVSVTVIPADAPPSLANAATYTAMLTQSGRAVQIGKTSQVTLPSGATLMVDYTANSAPNAVTGKQVRLELNTYYFFKNSKLAALTLYAPQGADNLDQWQHMAQSFKWGK